MENELPDRLYKYRPITTEKQRVFVKDIIVNNKLYFAPVSAFLDPFEFRLIENYQENPHHSNKAIRLDDSKSSYGIISFSEKFDSIPMWSFYADWHKGICIGFNVSQDDSMFQRANKVVYQHHPPSIDNINRDNKSDFLKACLTKPTAWSHEKEWRVVQEDRADTLQSFPPGKLCEIIIGMKTPEHHIQLLRKWISDRESSIRIMKAIPSKDSYSINRKTISM